VRKLSAAIFRRCETSFRRPSRQGINPQAESSSSLKAAIALSALILQVALRQSFLPLF